MYCFLRVQAGSVGGAVGSLGLSLTLNNRKEKRGLSPVSPAHLFIDAALAALLVYYPASLNLIF